MDSVSSRSKGTRLGVKRQGALFVARSGCQGLPGAAIDAAGTVGATGEPATKARRLPPGAPTQAHAAHSQPVNPLGLVSPPWAAHRRAPCRCTCALRLPPDGRSPGPAPGLTTGDSRHCCVPCCNSTWLAARRSLTRTGTWADHGRLHASTAILTPDGCSTDPQPASGLTTGETTPSPPDGRSTDPPPASGLTTGGDWQDTGAEIDALQFIQDPVHRLNTGYSTQDDSR